MYLGDTHALREILSKFLYDILNLTLPIFLYNAFLWNYSKYAKIFHGELIIMYFFLFIIGHFIYAFSRYLLAVDRVSYMNSFVHFMTKRKITCVSNTYSWWLCLGHYIMNALIAYINRYILMLWIVFPWLLLHIIIDDLLLTKIEYLLGFFLFEINGIMLR